MTKSASRRPSWVVRCFEPLHSQTCSWCYIRVFLHLLHPVFFCVFKKKHVPKVTKSVGWIPLGFILPQREVVEGTERFASWQRAFINDSSPTLLWIGGPWQTIAVVGMLEEQRRLLKRPRPTDRCCWKDERGVGASVPSQVWRRQGWQNTCNVFPFTLMISLYRFSYAATMKDAGGRGCDRAPLTAPPRSTCPFHNTRLNTRLHYEGCWHLPISMPEISCWLHIPFRSWISSLATRPYFWP